MSLMSSGIDWPSLGELHLGHGVQSKQQSPGQVEGGLDLGASHPSPLSGLEKGSGSRAGEIGRGV